MKVHIGLLLASAAFAVATSGCGGHSSGPAAPSLPSPSVVQSGRISDLQAARDIIDWNMNATGAASYRTVGKTCRWELPVPVRIAPGADWQQVLAALEYWAAQAGIIYRLVDSDAPPRLLVRLGTDGLAPWGGGRSVLDGTDVENRAISGLVVFEPGGGSYCRGGLTEPSCLYLYRHELGHIFGIFVNTGLGLMGSSSELSDREKRMFTALYSLPYGAVVSSDGTWFVAR